MTALSATALRVWGDRIAMSLSGLCALHCLLLPVVITLLPAVVSLGLADETFHLGMVLIVAPVSAIALTIGWRRHRSLAIPVIGGLGVVILLVSALAAHDLLGEWGERATALLGAVLVAWAHVKNQRLCRFSGDCGYTAGGTST